MGYRKTIIDYAAETMDLWSLHGAKRECPFNLSYPEGKDRELYPIDRGVYSVNII